MVDLLLPDVRVAKISPQLMDNTGRFSSPLTGTVRSVARPGDRWSFQLDYQNLQGVDRGRLESFIANMRGASNRALYSPGDYVQRGSFPSAEILSNNRFTIGTTGWTTDSTYSLSVSDRVMRATRNSSALSDTLKQSVSGLTQYAPYALRYMTQNGRGLQSLGAEFITSPITGVGSPAGSLMTISGAVTVTSDTVALHDFSSTGMLANDFFSVPFVSLSQCTLADNGPNLLTQSDALDSAVWNKNNCTVNSSGSVAPDGTTTGHGDIVETTANASHSLNQAVAVAATAADYAICVAVKPNFRSFCYLQMSEGTSGTVAIQYFNITTPSLGSLSVGANWSNLRAFVSPLGNGWVLCCMVATKTNAATNIGSFIGAAISNGTPSYTGNSSTVAISAWRATLAQSSAPTRLVQSSTTAVSAQPQVGNALYVKGLPAGASNLLLPGDWFEINKEIKRVTSALNSDAAGLGYLQFSPPLRNSPNDSDPVIINNPMGRFTLKNPSNGWASTPLYFASSSLVLEEAP